MRVAIGYAKITGLSTAKSLADFGFNAGQIAAATSMEVSPETQSVRWRQDTDPTASLGMPIAVGAFRDFQLPATNLKFIETTASAALNVTLYKE